jgi:hypothetical protein
MSRPPFAWLPLLAALALPAAAHNPATACKPGDAACAAKVIEASPARKLEYWSAALARPVEERIGAAPRELIELLAVDNVAHRLPNKPAVPALSEEFLADVSAAFAELPEPLRRRVSEKLVGIYFADDMGSTGFSDIVYDATGAPKAGFILLDPTVLQRYTANAWATWKESTPFSPAPGVRLEAIIEDSAHDTRMAAIQYILLHELGHVASVGTPFHPKRRRGVVDHMVAKLPASGMTAVYTRLENTNFPTLYAATHPADDFAESLASYVHTVMLRKPFEIRIYREGTLEKRYGSCWDEERCAAKRRILEEYLDPK